MWLLCSSFVPAVLCVRLRVCVRSCVCLSVCVLAVCPLSSYLCVCVSVCRRLVDLADLSAALDRKPRAQSLTKSLSSSLHIVNLSGQTLIDNRTLSTRSASGRFSTAALMGAPVSTGKWYFEVTTVNNELMQVRACVRVFADQPVAQAESHKRTTVRCFVGC